MIDWPHIIKQQQFDLDYPYEDSALNLQSRLSRLQSKSIEQVIEKVFNEMIPADRLYKIDQLTLDLGSISIHELEQELPYRIEEKLSEQLRRMIFQSDLSLKEGQGPVGISLQYSRLDQLKYYLQSGVFPWWYAQSDFYSPDAILNELTLKEKRRIAALIREEGRNPFVFKRLLRQFSFKTLLNLVKAFEPAYEKELEDLILYPIRLERLDENKRYGIRDSILESTLKWFIERKPTHFLRSDFEKFIENELSDIYDKKTLSYLKKEKGKPPNQITSVQKLIHYLKYGYLSAGQQSRDDTTPDALMKDALKENAQLLVETLRRERLPVIFDRITQQLSFELKREFLVKAYPKYPSAFRLLYQSHQKLKTRHQLRMKGLTIFEENLVDLMLKQILSSAQHDLDFMQLLLDLSDELGIKASTRNDFLVILRELYQKDPDGKWKDFYPSIDQKLSAYLDDRVRSSDDVKTGTIITESDAVRDEDVPASSSNVVLEDDKLQYLMHFLRFGYLPVIGKKVSVVWGAKDIQEILLELMDAEPIRFLHSIDTALPNKVVRERLIVQFDESAVDQVFRFLTEQKDEFGFSYLWYRQALDMWGILLMDKAQRADLNYLTKLFFLESTVKDWTRYTQTQFFNRLFEFLESEISFPFVSLKLRMDQKSFSASAELAVPILILIQWIGSRTIVDSQVEGTVEFLAQQLNAGSKKTGLKDAASILDKFKVEEAAVIALQHYLKFGFVPHEYQIPSKEAADDLLLTAFSKSPEPALLAIREIGDHPGVYDVFIEKFSSRSIDVYLEYYFYEQSDILEQLKSFTFRTLEKLPELKIKGDRAEVKYSRNLLRFSLQKGKKPPNLIGLFRMLLKSFDISDPELTKRFYDVFIDIVKMEKPEKLQLFKDMANELLTVAVPESELETGGPVEEYFVFESKPKPNPEQQQEHQEPAGAGEKRLSEELQEPERYDDAGIDEQDKKRETGYEFEIKDEIYITNAGLVLLAPYFPKYFEQLNLVKSGQFIDEPSAEKAIHLLQHLATGKEGFREPELVLNKILCGIPVIQPIEQDVEINSVDQEESLELLHAVINNWPALNKLSIDELRHNFLHRDGVLDFKFDRVNLKVDRKAYDVLMNSLPWSISIVKNTWMEKPLYVEWN